MFNDCKGDDGFRGECRERVDFSSKSKMVRYVLAKWLLTICCLNKVSIVYQVETPILHQLSQYMWYMQYRQ